MERHYAENKHYYAVRDSSGAWGVRVSGTDVWVAAQDEKDAREAAKLFNTGELARWEPYRKQELPRLV